MPRRDAIATIGAAAAVLGVTGAARSQSGSPGQPPRFSSKDLGWDESARKYILPPLPYAYDALEPHIDRQTMELHHDKHHAGYVTGLNTALEALAEIRPGKRNTSEMKHWCRELAFHGSGHFLHVLFWNCMGSKGGGAPSGDLAAHLERDFGSFKEFSDHFRSAAVSVEGSGWGVLAFEPTARRLLVMQAEKHQDLAAWGVHPLLVVDVWEHAYYLRYQNRRREYVDAFMNTVNWNAVAAMYETMV
jgi:Fe-Mn family superoxide dismutase